MQTLHRPRDRLVGERTALINQLRAILLERGIIVPQGKRKLEQSLAVLLDEQGGAGLSPRMITLVIDARAHGADEGERGRPSLDDHSGRRPYDRLCIDRGDWQGGDVRART